MFVDFSSQIYFQTNYWKALLNFSSFLRLFGAKSRARNFQLATKIDNCRLMFHNEMNSFITRRHRHGVVSPFVVAKKRKLLAPTCRLPDAHYNGEMSSYGKTLPLPHSPCYEHCSHILKSENSSESETTFLPVWPHFRRRYKTKLFRFVSLTICVMCKWRRGSGQQFISPSHES